MKFAIRREDVRNILLAKVSFPTPGAPNKNKGTSIRLREMIKANISFIEVDSEIMPSQLLPEYGLIAIDDSFPMN